MPDLGSGARSHVNKPFQKNGRVKRQFRHYSINLSPDTLKELERLAAKENIAIAEAMRQVIYKGLKSEAMEDMKVLAYPVRLQKAGNGSGYIATSIDVPEMWVVGKTETEALLLAAEAIPELIGYKDHCPLPSEICYDDIPINVFFE